jgi:hypothetical protein
MQRKRLYTLMLPLDLVGSLASGSFAVASLLAIQWKTINDIRSYRKTFAIHSIAKS